MSRAPWPFYGLVMLAAVPFFVLSALPVDLLPVGLPSGAVMVVVPTVVALAMAGRRDLLRRLRPRRPRLRPVVAIGAIAVTAVLAQAALTGRPFDGLTVGLLDLPVLAALFLVSGLAEEIGFMTQGYEPGRDRWGGLGSALVLGVFWAVWHVPHHLVSGHDATWIAFWFLGTVALRFVLCAIYEAADDGLWSAAIGHAVINLAVLTLPGADLASVQAAYAVGFTVLACVLVPTARSGARAPARLS